MKLRKSARQLTRRIKGWEELAGNQVKPTDKRVPNGNGMQNMNHHRPGSQKSR